MPAGITRREGLGLGLALGVGAGLTAATSGLARAADAEPSLQSLAAAKGLRFGSAVAAQGGGSIQNPQYAALLEAECGLLVPENELKWQAIRPSATQFDFTRFDAILAYADARKLAVRGHTLLWHRPQWMPGWLGGYDFGRDPAEDAARLLGRHIGTVCKRYSGRIKAYDVVNETVLPEDGSLAQTALSRAFGDTGTMLDFAYHAARAAAPDAQLVYNDYMSWEPGNEAHRAGVLRLLEGFRKRGTPVDALGVQSHLRALDNRAPQEKAWRSFIDAVVGMGYGLVITELDVGDNALPRDTERRDAQVAALAGGYLDMMLSYTQLRDVLVWGMCDSFSWLQTFDPLRSDGAAKRPCPYDADYRRKPLRAAIARSLAAAPVRH